MTHAAVASAQESVGKALATFVRALEDGEVTLDELPAVEVWAEQAVRDIQRAVECAKRDALRASWRDGD